MAGRVSVDESLRQLREIRDTGDPSKIREAVIKYLADKSNLIVAEAAKLVAENEIVGLEPDLIGAWERLFNHADPIKVDKGCAAKTAIILSLGQLDYDDPDLYLAAIKYRQIEPAWIEPQDTADSVRGNAAFSLARSRRIRPVDKLIAFVELLEGDRVDRVHAIQAMVDCGHESAIPLIRLKLQYPDDPEVVGACLSGLLTLSPEPSIPVVASFLDDDSEDIVLEAAAALGSCGRPKAVESLIKAFNRAANKDLRRSLLLSIGLSRDSSAVSFLITQLEDPDDAEAALDALRPACIYDETRCRVAEVLERLGDRKLIAVFEKRSG